jgi:AraC-like DNA-binding protein
MIAEGVIKLAWIKEAKCLKQVAGFVPTVNDTFLPDPYVIRAGAMQSLPNYKASNCLVGNEHILCLVNQGAGWLKTEGKLFGLQAGDMFCIFPEVPVSYGTDANNLMHKSWIGFSGAQVTALVDQLNLHPDHPVISVGSVTQVGLPLISEVREELKARKPGFIWRSTSLLWNLLSLIPTTLHTANEGTPSTADLMRQAMHYINIHHTDIARISDVAQYIGLSRARFSTLFKKENGLCPLDYLTEVRLNQAERLLAQTSHSVKFIAISVGIKDRAYFTRLFTAKRGITPQQYRISYQATSGSGVATGGLLANAY